MSPEEAIRSIQRWPTSRAKKWTQSFLASADKNDNIIAVIAVGSAVRPEVDSKDFDLIVLALNPRLLADKPPIEIDLRAYPMGKASSMIEQGNDILGWAVTYGKVLLDKDSKWGDVLSRWRNKVPLPGVDVALQRAKDAMRRFRSMQDVGDDGAAYEQAISCVTHLARATLLSRKHFPASRPELPAELRGLGCMSLAAALSKLLRKEEMSSIELRRLVESAQSDAATLSEHSWESNKH